MEKKEPHINVFPKINSGGLGRKGNTPTFDPDVETILNPKKQKNNIDILGMQHEPTEEEQNTAGGKSTTESQWPWLIIILAIIVIGLIIIIAWYVLKENNECDNKTPNIPRAIIQPNMQMNPQLNPQLNSAMYHNMYNQMHPSQNFTHPMHPMNRPQTENLPIQTKSMSSSSKTPTKQELMATLNQMTLEPIKEYETNTKPVKTLKPSKKQEKKINTDQEQNGEDDNDPQDDELASKFYKNLQQNINNDDKDNEEDDDTNAND